MIEYILYTVFILACFILILVVLLQPGKGDIASALGGGVGGGAFGPRGTTTLLAKITIGSALAFMGIAFVLSIPGLVTERSVTSGIEQPAEQPATPAEGTVPPEGAPADGTTTVPAGQLQIDEKGNLTTQPPEAGQQAPTNEAGGAPQQPEGQPQQ